MLSTPAADDLCFEFLGPNEALRWSWISPPHGPPTPVAYNFFRSDVNSWFYASAAYIHIYLPCLPLMLGKVGSLLRCAHMRSESLCQQKADSLSYSRMTKEVT